VTTRNELDLIVKVRAGEHEYFHDLIRPYERAMYSIAYSILRNTADAEEVAQEAAFKAFQHLDQLDKDDKFKSWLLRITNNEALMRRRKDRRDLYESIDSSEQEEENEDFRPRTFADWRDLPNDALDREELRKAIRDAAAKLPEKYRIVFVLADGQSLAYNVIAETLNLTVSNVKTRLHRARMMLQEHLSPAFKPRMSDHIELLKGMNPWSRASK
jgi:RNA polymerase sigma-70 factor (ECF subfamily)